MNQSNPVVDLQVNINANKSSIIKYPVKIYCIVDDLSAASKDRLIRDIKAHTIHSGAIFIHVNMIRRNSPMTVMLYSVFLHFTPTLIKAIIAHFTQTRVP
jgi:hypothetical protein